MRRVSRRWRTTWPPWTWREHVRGGGEKEVSLRRMGLVRRRKNESDQEANPLMQTFLCKSRQVIETPSVMAHRKAKQEAEEAYRAAVQRTSARTKRHRVE